MGEGSGFVAAIVLLTAGIFLLVQLALSFFVLCRFLAKPDKSTARPFLLTVASALASLAICTSRVFPAAFIYGLFSGENQIDLILYLSAMFVGLLFSCELVLSRSLFFRLAGAFGMFFLVINLTPGISDYIYQAQYTSKPRDPSKTFTEIPAQAVPEKVVMKLDQPGHGFSS